MQDKGKTPSSGGPNMPQHHTQKPKESIDESIGYSDKFDSPDGKRSKS